MLRRLLPPMGRVLTLALTLTSVGACRRPAEPTVELPSDLLFSETGELAFSRWFRSE